MNLKFDTVTLRKWENAGVKAVRASFVSGGCAGTKLDVSPADPETLKENEAIAESNGDVSVIFDRQDEEKFRNARITGLEKNGRVVWIYSDGAVKGRCWCGSSFSFSKTDEIASSHTKKSPIKGLDMEKLRRLKSAFAEK